jgi:hypothetical protein
LATFILHRGGYGLHGFFSLEEHHARDLEGYYRSLAVHPHHNYYKGRAEADLTPWLEYFIKTLAGVFEMVRQEAARCAKEGVPTEPAELRRLDRRARLVLGLFAKADRVTTVDVARALGLSERMARNLLQKWVTDGWLLASNPLRPLVLCRVHFSASQTPVTTIRTAWNILSTIPNCLPGRRLGEADGTTEKLLVPIETTFDGPTPEGDTLSGRRVVTNS